MHAVDWDPPTALWWSFRRFQFLFVFVWFGKNTENEVCVRGRHLHWRARDREVAREPESRWHALLPCPMMAHARRHARAVSRMCATAARTAKSFRALRTLHRAPVGQGPCHGPRPPRLAMVFRFWYWLALATGTAALAGLSLIQYNHHQARWCRTTCDFYPNNPNNPSKVAIIRPKGDEPRGNFL